MPATDILVVDCSPELAQRVSNILRDSGISVRVSTASTEYDLSAIEDEQRFGLVLFGHPDPQDLPFEATLNRLHSSFSAPVYLYAAADDGDRIKQALQHGAVGLVDDQSADHLVRIAKREFEARNATQLLAGNQQKLAEIEHRYNLLLDSSRDAIAYIHEGLHIYANPSYLELFDIDDFSALEGASILELITLEDHDFKQLLRQINQGQLPEGPIAASAGSGEDGEPMGVSVTFSAARYNGEHCTQIMVQRRRATGDMQQALESELEKLRNRDPVTGLFLRQHFIKTLQQEISVSRDTSHAHAVLRVEPDSFEALIQEQGASKTDLIINDLADVLKQCCEEQDLCARYRDHIFLVYLNRENKEAIEAVAGAILTHYRDHIIDLGERSITNTCSIGLTYLGSQTTSVEEVLQQCGFAAAEAHEKGGDQFARYRPQLTAVATDDSQKHWAEKIRHALNNNEFFVIQQPIVDLEKDSEPYHEAFVYMRDDGADLSPSEYLPHAEQTNLAGSIDRISIPYLLRSLANPDEQSDINAYIMNLSSNSVEDESFGDWLGIQLREHQVAGERLILQLPSSYVAGNLKTSQQLIERLQQTGCQFSISELVNERRVLSTLDHLDIQYVKLDPELTANLHTDMNAMDVVNRVVDIASRKSIQVIAGEVADAASLANLWQSGVKLVQGDFLKEKSQVTSQA